MKLTLTQVKLNVAAALAAEEHEGEPIWDTETLAEFETRLALDPSVADVVETVVTVFDMDGVDAWEYVMLACVEPVTAADFTS